jgi:hypothetical protein
MTDGRLLDGIGTDSDDTNLIIEGDEDEEYALVECRGLWDEAEEEEEELDYDK